MSSVSLAGDAEQRQLIEEVSHDDDTGNSSEDRVEAATQLVEANDAESTTKKPMAVKSASVTATKVQLSRRAADEMRFRLLQNLGIDKQSQQQQKQQQQVTAITSTTTPLPPPAGKNSEPWGPSYTISLNDASNFSPADVSSTESTTSTATADNSVQNSGGADVVVDPPPSTTHPKKKKPLRFHPTVTVHPIPSCKVYSSRIRDTIWTGSYELHENVARNSLEFSYEDWDPEHVLDEDTGLIYVQHQTTNNNTNNNPGKKMNNGGGEWVHPVHYGAPARDMGTPLASDEIWEYTCQQKLGIPTAESFHSLPSITQNKN